MRLSFIILNYRSKNFLENCLNSINQHIGSSFNYEIILVNNDPEEILEDLQNVFPNIQIMNSGANYGFSKACNAGARLAKGDFLFFLNPDTKFLDGSILEIINILKSGHAHIVSPKLIMENGEAQPWSCGYAVTLWDILKNNFGNIKSKKLWHGESETEVDWVSGATMCMTKQIFDKLGGFDENFFMYFEDVDFCTRAKKEKLKIVMYPAFKVLHIGGVSKENNKMQKKQYYSSQDYYFKKHFGQLHTFLLRLFRSAGNLFND